MTVSRRFAGPILDSIGIYKLPYIFGRIRYKVKNCFHRAPEKIYDLVFVVHKADRGRILDRICKEIASGFTGKAHFSYKLANLPPARIYFFSHYSYLIKALKRDSHLWGSRLFAWYTHPRGVEEFGIREKEFIYALKQATRIIAACSANIRLLSSKGVHPSRVVYILGGGADPAVFEGHERRGAVVGFCSTYYERKNPETILSVIKAMPHRRFILLGDGWRKYNRFEELSSLPSLTYVEAPYEDYPKYYAKMDVFVSPSTLEGGPVSLIEAMMCNIVPVASRTGFAPDIITHGENGFLFDIESQPEEICGLIEKAFEMKRDIRKTVKHLTWKNFSAQVQELFNK